MKESLKKTAPMVAVIALLMLLAGCGNTSAGVSPAQKPAPEVSQTQASTPSADQAPAPNAAASQVLIDNFTFEPARLTVKVGTTVTWINRDDVPHTATSTTKPRAFDSGALDTDGQFSHVFDKPGTYDYFCAVHPHMTGQIIVK